MTEPQKPQQEREIPILAIYKENGSYVVEVNETGEALDAAYTHLAVTFARALSRPGSEPRL